MSTETLPKAELEFTDYELDQINAEFAKLNPLERIEKAHKIFGSDLIAATTFGPTAPLMLQMISDFDRNIRVVTIRLGHETNKTKVLADWYRLTLGFDLAIYGDDIPISEDAEILRDRKIEIFQEMIDDVQPKAVLFGVMSWQTEERETMPFIERRGSIIAINPVLDVEKEDVDKFFVHTGLPRNINYGDPTKGPDQKSECRLNQTAFS